jgi:hypothetical protein
VQVAARLSERDRRHDPVEPAIEVIEILLKGGILQHLAPPSNGDGAQQQSPERRAERHIAALDRVFRVAQQMREAYLPQDAVAPLAAQHVRHPNFWPDFTHSPPILPLTRAEVSSEQATGLASTTFSIAAVASSKGSLARARMLQIAPSLIDSENSSSISNASRSHADGMGVMQIHRHGGDGVTERRSRLKSGRSFPRLSSPVSG